ncbi:MAG: hypothetical protein ACTSVM_05285 [Candidatus Ranarchaeia archaeon]
MSEPKLASRKKGLSRRESAPTSFQRSMSAESLREIGALTEILRDELMSSLGVRRMVVLTMTKEGPMVIRHDPYTGNIYQSPISLQSSIRSLLS